MTENYMILALLKTQVSQAALVRALRAAYDAGAAGNFNTRAVADGFILAFERNIGEDAQMLREEIDGDITPAKIVHQAMVQLSVEFHNFGLEGPDDTPENIEEVCAILETVQTAIKVTGWMPFPDELVAEVCVIGEREAEANLS